MIRSILILGLFPVIALSQAARTMYSDPIFIGTYVTDPRAVIAGGARQSHWLVQEEAPGKVILRLNEPKLKVVTAVHFTAEKIWIENVSQSMAECRQPKPKPAGTFGSGEIKPRVCDVSDWTMERWHLFLRRGMLAQLRELALKDATARYESLQKISDKPSALPAR